MIRCSESACKAAALDHNKAVDRYGWRWHWKTGWRCYDHLLPEEEYEEQRKKYEPVTGAGPLFPQEIQGE